jgi:hypothetical protein
MPGGDKEVGLRDLESLPRPTIAAPSPGRPKAPPRGNLVKDGALDRLAVAIFNVSPANVRANEVPNPHRRHLGGLKPYDHAAAA